MQNGGYEILLMVVGLGVIVSAVFYLSISRELKLPWLLVIPNNCSTIYKHQIWFSSMIYLSKRMVEIKLGREFVHLHGYLNM